jgi:hypothetical protein
MGVDTVNLHRPAAAAPAPAAPAAPKRQSLPFPTFHPFSSPDAQYELKWGRRVMPRTLTAVTNGAADEQAMWYGNGVDAASVYG